MKALTRILTVVLSLVLLASCGSGEYKLKLAVEDETGKSSESGNQGNSNAGSGSSAEENESENNDATENETENSGGTKEGQENSGGATTAQESNDTEGGIEYLEQNSSNIDDRLFMGTYQFQSYVYYSSSYPSACEYGFPLIVRAYSHDGVIDFENASGKLVWIAELYPDETFDFEVGFLNKFGNPSIELICTCYIDEAYYDYYSDEIQCGCEPTNDDENCAAFYEKVEN